MAIKKLYDAAVKTRTYQDHRTGETKAVWQTVGALSRGWAKRAQADLDTGAGRPLRTVAGAIRKSCAWELMRVLNALEKENPLEGGPLPPQCADRESA